MAPDDGKFRNILPLALGVGALAAFARRGSGDTGNQSPNASINVSTDNLMLTATASGSSDQDGQLVRYEWDFGDGSTRTTETPTTQYQYQSEGQYQVAVTVFDNQGASARAQTTVSVATGNSAPTASLNASLDGAKATLTASGSTDPDGNITEYRWSFGDGTTDVTGASDPTVQHQYDTTSSVQTVQPAVTVVDSEGARDTAETTLSIPANAAPSGSLTVSYPDPYQGTDAIQIEASGSDPDGQEVEALLESYVNGTKTDQLGWEPVVNFGNFSWSLTSIDAQSGDDVRVDLTVRDTFGTTSTTSDSVTLSFDDGGSGGDTDPQEFDHALSLSVIDRVQIEPDVPINVRTSGDLLLEGDENQEFHGDLDNGGGWANPVLDPNDGATIIRYNGELTRLHWEEAPISAFRDGNQIDPYDVSGDGPRERWLDGEGGEVVEVTVRQTDTSYWAHSYDPSRAAAKWIAGALKLRNVSHDVLYDLPPVSIPSEDTTCQNPYIGDDQCPGKDGCKSMDCCEWELALPSAYYWWEDLIEGNGLVSRFNRDYGADVSSCCEPAILRKDSNLLLTDRDGGGCGSVGGNVAVAGLQINNVPEYDPIPTSDGPGRKMHPVLHEFAHNLGYAHPTPEQDDHPCQKSGGRGENGSLTENLLDGYWYATPAMPSTEATPCHNRCGEFVPDREDITLMSRPYWTECDIGIFRAHTGTMQGATAQSYSRKQYVCDCSDEPMMYPRQQTVPTWKLYPDGGSSSDCDGC